MGSIIFGLATSDKYLLVEIDNDAVTNPFPSMEDPINPEEPGISGPEISTETPDELNTPIDDAGPPGVSPGAGGAAVPRGRQARKGYRTGGWGGSASGSQSNHVNVHVNNQNHLQQNVNHRSDGYNGGSGGNAGSYGGSGYHGSNGYRAGVWWTTTPKPKSRSTRWDWNQPQQRRTEAPAPPPEPIDCEMGAWKPFGQCKCNGGISCLDADGNPNLPYSSTERCVRKRSRPVAKRGAYGGRDDCQRKTEAKPCTNECKKPMQKNTAGWPMGNRSYKVKATAPPPAYPGGRVKEI